MDISVVSSCYVVLCASFLLINVTRESIMLERFTGWMSEMVSLCDVGFGYIIF